MTGVQTCALPICIAEALADHPDNDELKAAVVLEASAKKVVAVLQSGESITITGDGLKPVARISRPSPFVEQSIVPLIEDHTYPVRL